MQDLTVCPCEGKDIRRVISLKEYGNNMYVKNNWWFYGLVKLEDIESIHPRTEEKINKIALEISKNKKITPISISGYENGKFGITDGGHRVGAMRKLGYKYIPAIIDIKLKKDERIIEKIFKVIDDCKVPSLKY